MDVLDNIDSGMDGLISDLQRMIRQPSVSATGEGIEECATLVSEMLGEAGIRSRLLRIKGAAPMVYGEVESRANPRRTLMFYNHYDVQPAEPLELWDDPPFSGTMRDGRIFGRGATDDKGELITRIKAVESCLRTTGDVPCNIKFVIEGDEETGSVHIGEYLRRYRDTLACDAVVWEFGYVGADGRAIIGLGMKGLLFAELSVKESVRDAHSSLAVLIRNPAWRLMEAVSTLRSPDGRILIPGWYDEVVPLSREEVELIRKVPFDEAAFKREFGVGSLVGGTGGIQAKKALAAGPTCNIAGFVSGYTGTGVKTVLPGEARAKIDFRLVPRMDPERQALRLRRHLESGGFGDVGISIHHTEAAARTSPSDPFVRDVQDAARDSFGGFVTNVSNAETGPMHAFSSILGSPCVGIGSTHVFSRIHSPNEFARVDLLKKATRCMYRIMRNFGRS